MEEEKKECKGCKKIKEWLEKNTIVALACALVLGLLLGAGIMCLTTGSGKVARVNGKTISVKDLYNKMKNYTSINIALEDVDAAILNKKYTLESEELEQVKKTAQNYIDMYSNYYGYTEETFLSENGFKSKEDFIDYLSIDYKRTLYYYEQLEKQLEENAVKNYYDEYAFGKVNTKHILVQTESMSDEEALNIANEIIDRLNNGEDFDALAEEYTAKYQDTVITENLGEQGAFDNLEDGYVNGMKELNKGEYTKTPAKTSYGYHVIYCVDRTEKTENMSRKEKMAIIDVLAKDIMSKDSNLYYKTMIDMRKDAKLKFYDKDLAAKYEEYCEQYIDKNTADAVENSDDETEPENIEIETDAE